MSTTTAVDDFKAILSEQVPLCTGLIPLDANNSALFYRNATLGSAGCINFSTAVSDNQLDPLVQACQPATFGLQQKDVLDESYRKAWKMDADNFATHFNPNTTGIVQTIRDMLLKNRKSPFQIELYKLNVYGPGSFFKSHVDTPRSGKMFGSLVVVLPTKHEGGALSFRHHGREWTFDSADLLSRQNTTHAAFVSFFSDVEHEVAMVKSGYRVTLTYNLYFGSGIDKSAIGPSLLSIDDTDVRIKKSLINILNDKGFLPEGGLLGFSLSHQYPINPATTKLDELGKSLKGTDAAIKRACDSLSLDVSIMTLYEGRNEGIDCLLDGIFDIPEWERVECDLALYIRKVHPSALLVYDPTIPDDSRLGRTLQYGYDDARPILWMKPLTKKYHVLAPYVKYGNEATQGFAYGEICLVVEVKAFNDRAAYHE